MKKVFLSILLLFALVACDKNEDNQQGSVDKGYAVSVSEIIFPPAGGKQIFTVTSDTAWTINQTTKDILTHEGITIKPAIGDPGTTEVEVTAENATKDVEQDLTFSARYGEVFATIKLIQKRPVLNILQDHSLFNGNKFAWYTNNETENVPGFEIYSNTDWNIKDLPDWLEVIIDDNNDNNTGFIYPHDSGEATRFDSIRRYVTIKPKEYNLDAEELSDEIIIESGAGESKLTFSQGFRTLMATDSKNKKIETLNFGPINAGDTTITIHSDFESWDLSTEDLPAGTWSNTQRGYAGESQIAITPQANNQREEISGNIVITGSGSGYNVPDGVTPKRKIEVILEGYFLGFNNKNKEVAETAKELSWQGSTKDGVPFKSSGKWIIETGADSDWIDIVSATEGDGGDHFLEVKVKSENLHINTSREGSVILKSAESGVDLQATLPIVQDGFAFSTDLKDLVLDTDDTKSHTYTVTCSGPWEITTNNNNWLTVTPRNGEGDGEITIQANGVNSSTADRSITLALHSGKHKALSSNKQNEYGYKPISFTVTQKKYTFEVNPDGATYRFAALDGKTETIKVECSSNWSIEPIKNTGWIKINGSALTATVAKSGNQNISVSVEKNTNTSAREGSFKITSTFGGKTYEETFTITQEAFVFDTKADAINNMDALPTSSYSITLGECIGSWTVSAPNWISVNPSSGTGGNTTITIYPENNITQESDTDGRTDVVTITSNENKDLVKEITVHQNAHWLIVDKEKVDVNAKPSGATTINVQCPAKWDVLTTDSWIKFNKLSGNGNGTFTITVAENTGKERSATIIVMSRGENRNITVTQAAK